MVQDKIVKFVRKYLWIIALLAIICFSFIIRTTNSVPDRLLSYDPIFQYRFTKYFVDWGQLPLWDELGYYVGRAVETSTSPLIFYITSVIQSTLGSLMNWSLFTTAGFSAALYGAFMSVGAFLLAREMSNNWGGALAAVMVATAPQILTRTFGASFDTDQLAVFFILATLWLYLYALKRKTIFSYALALTGFILFMAAWSASWFTFFFPVAAGAIYAAFTFMKKGEEGGWKGAVSAGKQFAPFIAILFIGIIITGTILQMNPISGFFDLIGFAGSAEKAIVNISIAELQSVNLLDLNTWTLAMGGFSIGNQMLDSALFVTMLGFLAAGVYLSKKGNPIDSAYLIAIGLISIYSITRGIRFTEFSSALLTVMVAVGFGHLVKWSRKRSNYQFSIIMGIGILLFVATVGTGLTVAKQVGPDLNSNWDNAWEFLKTQTPENSIVGTWWDPGHMITGLAGRRVIADGAHCTSQCLYGINDRITSLGKILATTNESEAVELIRKYKGDATVGYWIASDDLIQKWQWPQYFGTGCDARTDGNCKLYYSLPIQNEMRATTGQVIVRDYGSIKVIEGGIPIPLFVQGNSAALFDGIIYYNEFGVPVEFHPTAADLNSMSSAIKGITDQLGLRIVNQTSPLTVWVPQHRSYVVAIPPELMNTMFTKEFFLDGQGLTQFREVFKNDQVKIYEVKL